MCFMPETPWCHFPCTNLLKGTLSRGLSPKERSRQQRQETSNALLSKSTFPHTILLKGTFPQKELALSNFSLYPSV